MIRSLCFSRYSIPYLVGVLLFVVSCTRTPSSESETVVTGKTIMLVDNTFEPIIEDQLAVFESSYKNAEITMINAPENRVFHLLLSDSAKVAIVTRELTEEEYTFFVAKNIIPKTRKFATDAVALITHNTNPDSIISVEEIIRILKGDPEESK